MKKQIKIVFHHIPKCGGMSIAAGLAMTYYPMTVLRHGRKGFPGHLNARAASEAAASLGIERYAYRRQLLEYHLADQNGSFIFGHYPFSKGAAQRYADRWSFVTLLRNPVERWYSEYYWNRYKNHDYAKTDLDMEAYLESAQGRADTRSFLNFFAECQNPSAVPAKAELEEAISNIEQFAVMGTLENLGKFQEDMKVRFGRRPFFIKRNKNPADSKIYVRPDPQSGFHKKLLEMLGADLEIYRKISAK